MNFFQIKRSSHKRKTTMNPLLLPSIVHRSFQYLNCNELLTCRHVNKMWRDEATKRLQDMVIVTLTDWHSIEQFNRVLSTHVKSFPSNMLNSVRLGPHVTLGDKNLQVALTKLAPVIRYLIVNTKVGSPEWRWLLFDQFANLKELHIYGNAPFQPIITTPAPEPGEGKLGSSSSMASLSSGTSGRLTPTNLGKVKELIHLTKLSFNLGNRKSEDIFVRRFLRDIFSVVPNLKYLNWIKEDRFANDFQRTMFDCLMMKTKPGSVGRLETFICPSLVCGTKELKDMTFRSYPLQEIHVQISSDVSAQYLETFLEGHAETLRVVKVDFCPGTPLNVMVSNPSSLIFLKEISLTEYRRSIGFVGFLPSLRKLTLTRTNIKRALLSIGWAFENKEQTELSESLLELYVFNDYLSREQGNCTREIVLKLAHCFPNLKAIRLEGLDDSSIRHLFKSFHKLEELYAPVGTYSDEAFRSFIGKDQMASNGSRSPSRFALSAFDASHLKNLRILELESIGLTDKFITNGIINWSSLRNLSVKYCRISFPVLCRILMEMGLHRLYLQYCTILTDGVLGVADDHVEMSHDDDILDMSYNAIQKWRVAAFKLLFVQIL